MSKKTVFVPPDFLQIPFIVICDKKLQPLDKTIYGFIYWLEKLKDGRCFASNNYIANALGSSPTTVSNSLARLEKQGYIIRPKNEDNQRSEIKCTVSYQKVTRTEVTPKVTSVDEGVTLTDEGGSHQMMNGVTSVDVHNKKTIIIKDEEENKSNDWQAIVLYFYSKISPETPPNKRFYKGTKEAAIHLLTLHSVKDIKERIDALVVSPEKKFMMTFLAFCPRFSTIKLPIVRAARPEPVVKVDQYGF